MLTNFKNFLNFSFPCVISIIKCAKLPSPIFSETSCLFKHSDFHSTGIIGLLKLNYNRHDYLINHVTILIFDSRFCKVTLFLQYIDMVISYRLSIRMSSINWSIDHFVGLNWSRIVFKICSYLEIHFLRARARGARPTFS